ncbi:hypothetical protein ACG9XW_18145 [Acinetobacter guillouiae]|uniref:hypothetical protein n=1 Tax=Acinetobacter guillouiae TaxID=106649 RepID=UPI003AF80C81
MKYKKYLNYKWFFDQQFSNLGYIQLYSMLFIFFIMIAVFYIIPADFRNYQSYKNANVYLKLIKNDQLEKDLSESNYQKKDFYSDLILMLFLHELHLINFKEIKKNDSIDYNVSLNGTWLDSRKFFTSFLKKFDGYKILSVRMERNSASNKITTHLILRRTL